MHSGAHQRGFNGEDRVTINISASFYQIGDFIKRVVVGCCVKHSFGSGGQNESEWSFPHTLRTIFGLHLIRCTHVENSDPSIDHTAWQLPGPDTPTSTILSENAW